MDKIDQVTEHENLQAMEMHELPFTKQVLKIIDLVVTSCEAHVADRTDILPVMHLINPEGHMEVIAGHFTDGNSKDQFAQFCRRRAQEFGADMVVFCSESWVLMTKDPEGFVMPPGGLKDHPDAESCVVVMIDTQTSSYMGQGMIKTKGTNQFMDKMLFFRQDGCEGRLAGILPKIQATVH